jgi:hypothetical protein
MRAYSSASSVGVHHQASATTGYVRHYGSTPVHFSDHAQIDRKGQLVLLLFSPRSGPNEYAIALVVGPT